MVINSRLSIFSLKHKQQVSLEAASRIQNELMAHLQKLKEERATPQTERDDSLQKAIYRYVLYLSFL